MSERGVSQVARSNPAVIIAKISLQSFFEGHRAFDLSPGISSKSE
jgi:hypothetical protein